MDLRRGGADAQPGRARPHLNVKERNCRHGAAHEPHRRRMGPAASRCRTSTPRTSRRWSASTPAPPPTTPGAPSPPPRRRSRPGRARGRSSGTACCARRRTRSLARKEELGRLLAREEGKSLPESIGETVRAAQIFDFFAGECLRLTGETVPSVRPGRRRRDDARGGGGRRADHALELPHRHPGLEDRAGARLRQHGGASSPPTWCRAAPGRSSTSCTAPGCRRGS